jgi:lipopolysaccharide transport system permease protein
LLRTARQEVESTEALGDEDRLEDGAAARAEQITVIDADSHAALVRPATVWEFRELVYFLARRDVAIRYKQSAIGVAWVILQPVLLAVVFSVFLGLLAKVPSDYGVPYPVFAVAGLVLWLFFSLAILRASDSAVSSGNLISKVWFPRIVIPVAAVLPPAMDFVIAFFVVVVTMLIYGVTPSPMIVLMPLMIPLVLAPALGIGIWLAALNVKYRDIGVAVPFLIQVGLFITPIIYPYSLVPDNVRALYALNPMVGALELYRWMLFSNAPFPGWLIIVPVVVAAIALVTGCRYFQNAERTFADVI